MKAVRETIPRGTPDFPLALYHHRGDRVSVVCHWHSEIELIWVHRGEFQVQIGRETYSASPGSIFFINREELHALSGNAGAYHFYSAVFYAELLDFKENNPLQRCCVSSLLEGAVRLPPVLLPSHPAYQTVFTQLQRLADGAKLPAPFGQAQQLLGLYEVLFCLAQTGGLLPGHGQEDGSDIFQTLKRVTEYAEAHFKEPVALGDLAAAAGMSRGYFCTFFRRYTGLTPTAYLNRLRLERASAQLLESGCSVTLAALDNGFESASYFIRAFKKMNGCTPGAFCKSRKAKSEKLVDSRW